MHAYKTERPRVETNTARLIIECKNNIFAALKKINDNMKIGIYSDAGSMTCENYQPGSYGLLP